jgi:riboflavin synthase
LRSSFEGTNINPKLLVNKGSVCINGVSLTIANTKDKTFEVAIIPYTYENTNFKALKANDLINIEYDILGKYILKNLKT